MHRGPGHRDVHDLEQLLNTLQQESTILQPKPEERTTSPDPSVDPHSASPVEPFKSAYAHSCALHSTKIPHVGTCFTPLYKLKQLRGQRGA